MKLVLPPLPGRDAVLWVEVEKDVVPALIGEPFLYCVGFKVVLARVTEEDTRHSLL